MPGCTFIFINSMKTQYHWQNYSLVHIKGEKWKDVPGLEGYFKVSCFGRVKRMKYISIFKNGMEYTRPEKVIHPNKTVWHNQLVGDQITYLTVLMALNGSRYQFSLARLVYHCFVKPIDLKDKRTAILYKDNDRFNILPGNLYLASQVQKSRYSIAAGRFKSPLYNLTTAQRRRIVDKASAISSKPVSQYGEDGRRVATFKSINEAGRKTGVHIAAIGKLANGKANGLRAGGYYWQFGNAARIPLKRIKEERARAIRTKYARPVTQYNMNGERIAVFLNTTEAAEKTGIFRTIITNLLNGINRSANGYYFMRGEGPERINLDGYVWGKQAIAISNSARYRQYTLNGRFVKEYQTAKEAAAAISRSSSAILEAAKGNTKHCGGYKWKMLPPKPHKQLGSKPNC
jgi:NUMOD4 motif